MCLPFSIFYAWPSLIELKGARRAIIVKSVPLSNNACSEDFRSDFKVNPPAPRRKTSVTRDSPQEIARSRLYTTDKRQIEQWPVEEWTSWIVSLLLSIVCWCRCRYHFLNYDSSPRVTINSDKISQQGVEQCYITMIKIMTLRETSNLNQPRSQWSLRKIFKLLFAIRYKINLSFCTFYNLSQSKGIKNIYAILR